MNFYLLPVLLTKQKILSSDEFRIKIKHHLNHDLLDTAKFFRVSLLEMNKENVQDIVVLFCFCSKWYFMWFKKKPVKFYSMSRFY